MTFSTMAPRGRKLARSLMAPMLAPMLAFGPLLAMGLVGAGVGAAPALAKDAAPKYSDKFIATAGPLQTALGKVPKGQKPDAATLESLKKQLDASIAAASTPDDKNAAGGFAVSIGSMAGDTKIQSVGVHLLLDSGKAAADQVPKLHYYIGSFAYQDKDYATAESELKVAINGGYKSADVLTMLAETQFAVNRTSDGLASLQQAIDAQKASGQPVPDGWYIRGMQMADTAKLTAPSAELAAQLVAAYPTTLNWTYAIDRLRVSSQYPPREMLDLMRLMGRTNSYATSNDYLEYVDLADPHRLPGEVRDVINAGVAAGKVNANSVSVADALATATKLIPADKASLPEAYRRAHEASATGSYAMQTGSALLGYGDTAKAIELYQLALTKPGVDVNVAYTRLGIAQSDAGDYAGAQASFAKVTGVRQPLARLWTIYCQQKSAAK